MQASCRQIWKLGIKLDKGVKLFSLETKWEKSKAAATEKAVTSKVHVYTYECMNVKKNGVWSIDPPLEARRDQVIVTMIDL